MIVKYASILTWLSVLVIFDAISAEEICFGELGCFPSEDCPRRPLNPGPYPRELINTQFMFFTRESPVVEKKISGYSINSKVLQRVPFKAGRRTMMVVHGWIDNIFLGKWMTLLKDALLRHGDYNVILVDWTGGNGLPYTQASVNTRVVGAEMGLLVSKLGATFGISPSSVHLYGHSLGGHVVGFAGKWLNGTLGRITSLDPAEPLFEYCPPEARISSTDAQYVEVVHTDSYPFIPRLGLGMHLAAGNVDFYPNGGQHMPGCSFTDRLKEITDKSILDGVRIIGGCNHMRSIDYTIDFIESSANRSTCLPIAFACPDYDLFESGQCVDCGADGTRCAVMGAEGDEFVLPAKKEENLRMFFRTNSRLPFCLYHYSIEVKLERHSSDTSFFRTLSGTLNIVVNTKYSYQRSFDLKHESGSDFTPGSTYRYLVSSEKAIEDVESVTLTYTNPKWIFAAKLLLKHLKFTPMTTSMARKDLKKLSKVFCAPPGGISSRRKVLLEERLCIADKTLSELNRVE